MRSDYIGADSFRCVLMALTYENRLAILVSLTTGLRLSDVLNLRTKDIRKQKITIKELKTGKTRRFRLDESLRDELISIAGKIYVFENRIDYRRPRSRQAVYKDLKRAAAAFRISSTLNISPHSARKIYAVENYKRTCSLQRVQQLLNHESEAVTTLYALADELTRKTHKPAQIKTSEL